MSKHLKIHSLPPDLWSWRKKIEAVAIEEGLDFFETVFEIIPYDKMNEIAAYGGFPTRYPHWRFGMAYEQMAKSYAYGLSKIYELVINTDPTYAFLLEGNEVVDQKLVMAHVFGHGDFFKNNYWFSQTNRKMLDQMANHASRVRRYVELYGQSVVEEFIDVCLTLENLIDVHSPYIPQKREVKGRKVDLPEEMMGDDAAVPRMRAKEYMEEYINPSDYIEAQKRKQAEEKQKRARFPAQPERDVLAFLLHNAPLTRWQRNVLGVIRDEAYYFAPQGMTKIMNEGWASYWHARIMTQRGILDDSEIIDFADRHSGTMVMHQGRLNPYKLGLELFRDIERRWDRGQFGKAYHECEDMAARAAWDTKAMKGREKIFEVRRSHNDITFLDEFLTPEFCAEQKLFTFAHHPRANEWQIASREFAEIKKKLLAQLTNMGQPIIEVEDGDYEQRSELLLVHRHAGVDLQDDYAYATLKNLFSLWKRPVHLATKKKSKDLLISFDGKQIHLK
ncbi:SpoVR family protein [Myxococcota bacterium]|nr:SpoVR family protein [Myxococcota bacterium]MBU1899004.1 SpoVR family protein [Myxococcota bacterium]